MAAGTSSIRTTGCIGDAYVRSIARFPGRNKFLAFAAAFDKTGSASADVFDAVRVNYALAGSRARQQDRDLCGTHSQDVEKARIALTRSPSC